MMPHKTPEERRAYRAAYYKANRQKVLARVAAYRKENPEKIREQHRLHEAANRDSINQRRREQYERNRERVAERNKTYRKNNLAKVRWWGRKSRGLPPPTRLEPPTCECCGQPPGDKSMNLDHCHVSGMFRGWLCFNCNIGIGKFGESIKGLMNAVRYLERAGIEAGRRE